MFKSFTLIVAVAGAYALLRGWAGAPSFLMRSCVAVALLVTGLVFWGIRHDPKLAKLISMRRAGWMDYFSLGAAVVFAELFFVVLASVAVGPAQNVAGLAAGAVADAVSYGGGRREEVGGEEFDDSGSGNWLFKPTLERNLPQRSNHQPGIKPQVFVKLDRGEDVAHLLKSRVHLRSFAFSRFDGLNWSAAPTVRRELSAPISFESGLESSQQGNRVGDVVKYRVFQGVNPTGQNVWSSLHGAVNTDADQLTQVSESIFLLPQLEDERDGYDYEVRSRSVHFTDLINRPLVAAESSPDELSLPGFLRGRISQTVLSMSGEPDLSRRLVAVRSYLQDHYKYSLETSNHQNGNPLENFLYTEKQGYCEHFATAAAMFCRALGVPSRIAYGWSGGVVYRSQNMFVFRAKDAHAWTEIKLDGYGWVVFDTTPADDQATPETQTAPENEPVPDPRDVLSEQYQRDQELRSGSRPDAGRAFDIDARPLMIALGVIFFGGVVFLLMRVYFGAKCDSEGRQGVGRPPAYLLKFKQVCASMGYQVPVGRTLRQQIDKLRPLENPPGFLEDLLEYHYGVLYEGREKDKAVEKCLVQSMERWRKEACDSS